MRGVVLVAVVVAVLGSHMRSSTATVERAVVLLVSMLVGVEDTESGIVKGFVGWKVWRYRDGRSVRGGARRVAGHSRWKAEGRHDWTIVRSELRMWHVMFWYMVLWDHLVE